MTIDSFRGTYHFLSNFYRDPFLFNGRVYETAEHAYQAAKTYDPEWFERIAEAWSPAEAKALGRAAPVWGKWDEVKDRVMRDIVFAKFYKYPLRTLLVNTGDEELVEGNSWGDTYWGVCNGQGENRLGKILMEVREYYKRVEDGIARLERIGILEDWQILSFESPMIFNLSTSRYDRGVYGPAWATIVLRGEGLVRKVVKVQARDAWDSLVLVMCEADRVSRETFGKGLLPEDPLREQASGA